MKQILALPSVHPHPNIIWRRGMISASLRSDVHAREECLTESLSPRFLCFSEPKYFPSGEEKQRWLTVRSWVSSAALLTAWWCAHAADVRASDSWLTARGWERGKTKHAHSAGRTPCLQRSKHGRCRLNPFAVRAHSARLGKHLPAPAAGCSSSSRPPREPRALHFWGRK